MADPLVLPQRRRDGHGMADTSSCAPAPGPAAPRSARRPRVPATSSPHLPALILGPLLLVIVGIAAAAKTGSYGYVGAGLVVVVMGAAVLTLDIEGLRGGSATVRAAAWTTRSCSSRRPRHVLPGAGTSSRGVVRLADRPSRRADGRRLRSTDHGSAP
jgi:hypothetical protein